MSDCSTNAFKVPEGMCSCNRSRGYDDLLERYQQLEQVAIQAYKWFVGAGEERFSVGKEEASFMRDQLEALGVDV